LSLTSSKTYDWRGRVETATAESGLVTSTVYDNDARTTTTTYPGGGTRIVKKYRDGRIQSITGTAQVAEYYTYGVNSDGSTWTRIDTAYAADDTSILEADRRWVKTTYDMVSRIKKIEKPGYNGSTLLTENYYNNKGQLEKRVSGVSGGDTQTWLYEYDELGTLKRIGLEVDDVGGADLLNVASMDRITDYETVYEDVGGTWHKKETTTIYPDDNSGTAQILSIQKTQLTGLGGVDTSGTYDGKLISKTVTTDVYSKDTVHYTYVNLDDEGTSGVDEQKVTQVIDIPTSSQDAIVIIEGGLKTSETSTTGVETTFDYDSLGRLYTETILSDADLNGADERTVSTEYAYYSSEIGEKGRLQSITQVIAGSDDNTVTYTYDSITGKLHEETKQATLADSNPQTVTTTYSYYDTTRKLKKVEGSQYPVEYGYDEYGQLNSLKTWQDDSVSAGFVETTWGYDPATGLLENKRYDNAGDTGVGPDYEYFEDGKLKSRTWVRKTGDNPGDPSIKTDYAYHDTGELKKISYNDGTHAVYLGAESGSSTTYLNRQGLPTKIEDEQGTRSLSFTISSELDDESIASVYALSRDFDSYGRPAGYDLTTATPGQDIVYGYDSRGRFGSVYYSIDGKSDTFTYSWVDGADLLKGYSTAGATPAASIEYGYEINRDLKTEVVNESLGANVSTFEYVYDEIGRRKTRDDTFESQPAIANQFLYNARSEVTDADMDGTSGFEDVYDFDDIGNRITSALDGGSTITYARNDLNQYTGLSGGATATLTYDEDGNLENDGIWTYEWNGENRLKAMEKINKVDGSERLEFKYDFMGRRYQKDVYVWATGSFPATPDTTSTFIYDGWNLIHESFAASSRSYVWGLDLSQTLQGAGGVAGLLCSIHKPDGGNSAVYYSMADANGNISDYVDASGNVTAHFEYDAFGQIVNAPATQGPMPNAFQFRYSSKYQDAETDLNYYGYRYYTPEVGRWLNRDPIDEIGGINLYASNGNDSFNNNDYMGLIVACDCYDFEIVEAIVTFWTATRTYIPASGEHRIIQGDKRIDGIFYNVIFDEDRCECLEYSGKNVQVDYVSNIGRDEDLAARDKHQHTTRLTYGFTGDGSTVPHPPGWNIEMWEMSGFERVRYGDKIEWNWSIEGTECGSGTYLVF
jgi:RHS repeat-associated protein